MAYTVYMHTSPSGKRYVGVTKRKPEKRWEGGKGYKGQPFWNAVEKYGWDNIVHEILLTGLTKEEAEEKERYFVELFRTSFSEFGYNCDSGGNLGKEITDETRKRLSESHMGHTHTEEARAKIGAASRGRVLPAETRRKISEAHLGRPSPIKGIPKSAETRRRMSEAAKGKVVSEETRRKLSEINKGRSGHPLSEEARAKIGKLKSKPVVNLDTGGFFESVKAAGVCYGVDPATISACLSGRTKTAAGGYHWAYADKSQ